MSFLRLVFYSAVFMQEWPSVAKTYLRVGDEIYRFDGNPKTQKGALTRLKGNSEQKYYSVDELPDEIEILKIQVTYQKTGEEQNGRKVA